MAYLVGGGYEGQIIGYQLSGELLKPAEDGAPRKAPAPIFAFSAHTGLIRTVACSAGLLATGSTDNTLGCYNLRKRRFFRYFAVDLLASCMCALRAALQSLWQAPQHYVHTGMLPSCVTEH